MSKLPFATMSIGRTRQFHLMELATAIGALSVNEALGQLVRSFADEGLISGTIPGVKINAASDGIVIRLLDNEPVGFTPTAARDLATFLRGYASGDRLGTSENPKHNFAIWRRGRQSLRVAIPMGAPELSIAQDIGFDLADHIDRALAKVPENVS